MPLPGPSCTVIPLILRGLARSSLKDGDNAGDAVFLSEFFLLFFLLYGQMRFRDQTSLRAIMRPVASDPRLSTLTQDASLAAYAACSVRP